MKVTALIMAGGKGERFWPRSRVNMPKQFLSLTDDGKTMIQLTVERISPIVDIKDVYIATNERTCKDTVTWTSGGEYSV
jgi:mannose-1-phosphate guanylyltransferase